MNVLQTAADVLCVEIDDKGDSEGATVVMDWGGRKVEYRVSVACDFLSENLYVAVVRFPGYVRGLLVVDRRGSSECIQLHIYDGSKIKVKDVVKGNLFATLATAAPLITSSHQFMNDSEPEWVPIAWSLSISV